jgi:glutamyl-tRNA reductase
MDGLRFHSAEAPTTARVPEDDELANGFLYDMDDLHQGVRANHEQPQREVAWGEEIESEDGEFAARRVTLRELSPTIVAVGRRLEQIRSAELERWGRELRVLDPVQRRASRLSHEAF